MAFGKRLDRRLSLVFVAPLVFALSFAALSDDAFAAKQRASHHFTSQESHQRPEKYRSGSFKSTSARKFKVKTRRIASLKKSSFWNTRPYQFATPLVAGDRIFVGVDAGRFYAFDLEKGKQLWEFQTDGPVHSKAAYADGAVYVPDVEGRVYALDAGSGEKRWTATLDTDILATPYVEGNRLYVATMSGRLYALDISTGVELWHTDTDEKEFGFSVRRSSAPVAAGGVVLYGTSSGLLRAVRGSDGSQVWSRQLSEKKGQVYDVDSEPLLYNGKVYESTAEGTLSSIDLASGRIIWTVDAGGVNDPIAKDGRIYCTGGGSLYALDPDSGDIYWQQDLEVPEISSPVSNDNYIAVTSTREKIYLIDRDSGDIAYERYIGKGSYGDPIVSGDKVYLLGNTGKLFSFLIKEAEPKEEAKVKKGKKKAE